MIFKTLACSALVTMALSAAMVSASMEDINASAVFSKMHDDGVYVEIPPPSESSQEPQGEA